MEDHQQQEGKSPRQQQQQQQEKTTTEPVRSRWTPKPEQILILESIFNSGMVNPPKEETVRIRKLLEKFGSVGDANVFYWFQNRRSRSRRRQRQLQASLLDQPTQPQVDGGAIPYGHVQAINNPHTTTLASSTMGFSDSSYVAGSGSGSGSSSSCGVRASQEALAMDGFFSVSPQMGGAAFPEIDHASSVMYPPFDPNFNYHSGYGGSSTTTTSSNISGLVTVFINGIATELPRGPIDMKTVFGEDVMLVHSSGVPLPTNEFGFLMHTLHHGESYFLVSKTTTQV